MRRSDRLFDLIQMLRDGRLHRASEMAAQMQVSVRTIWRDMTTLMESGLPVEGERGVGYILRAPITLPPMMLNLAELEALRAGLSHVAKGADTGLARAARGLAAKIAAVTPAPVSGQADDLFALHRKKPSRQKPHLPPLRIAIRGKERVTLSYLELDGQESHGDIRPLRLDLSGRVWTLTTWCETRHDFRVFRVDRVLALARTGERFVAEKGTTLGDLASRTEIKNSF